MNNLVTKIFQLFLFLSTICIGSNVHMDMFDIILFRTGVSILFIASLWDTQKRTLPKEHIIAITSLLGLTVYNICVHSFAPVVMSNFMNLSFFLIAYYLVYTYFDTSKIQLTCKIILMASFINIVYFLLQVMGFDPAWNQKTSDKLDSLGGFIGNRSRLVNYFSLVIPFIYLLTNKLYIKLILLFVIVGISLYLQQYIIFLPCLVILLCMLKPKARYILCAIFLLICAVLHKHILASFNWRITYSWKPTILAFFQRPLLGLGLGVVIDNLGFI